MAGSDAEDADAHQKSYKPVNDHRLKYGFRLNFLVLQLKFLNHVQVD